MAASTAASASNASAASVKAVATSAPQPASPATNIPAWSGTQTVGHELTAEQVAWYTARLAFNGQYNGTTPPSPTPPHLRHELAETIVTWDRLRRTLDRATFEELSQFLLANPGWPMERQLRVQAEQAMKPTVIDADRLTFFGRFAPLTATGKLRYAESLAVSGQISRANTLAREAWTSGNLGIEDEQRLLRMFAGALTDADHVTRTNQQLWTNRLTAARRMLPLLGDDRRAWAAARIALQTMDPQAPNLVAAVPEALKTEAGLALDRARWLRLKQKDAAQAADVILAAAVTPATLPDRSAWAKELELLAEAARDAANHELAYRLLAQHRITHAVPDMAMGSDDDRVAFTDLEWEAGWVALRTLRRPQDAIRHFEAVHQAARTPMTQSRAAFWAGRAAEAMNAAEQARAWYSRAAQHSDFFYGLMAAERLGQPVTPPSMTPPVVTAAQAESFRTATLTRAGRILGQLGQSGMQATVLRHMGAQASSPQETRLVLDMAQEVGRVDLAIAIAKAARNKGVPVHYASFPYIAVPDQLAPQWVTIHAITRQESLFNAGAVSPAGARGLMQLMPATAQEVAQKLGLPYDRGRLHETEYNIMLGSAYFQRLLDAYSGNHVLAVAAYNAGPGNVRRWLNRYGDPRDPTIDVIDWMEQIPYSETRNYVQRVLENAVIYSMLQPGRAQTQPRTRLLSRYLGLIGDS